MVTWFMFIMKHDPITDSDNDHDGCHDTGFFTAICQNPKGTYALDTERMQPGAERRRNDDRFVNASVSIGISLQMIEKYQTSNCF